MVNTKTVAPPAARTATRSVATENQDPAAMLQGMTSEQRLALMEQLRQAQQDDVAPLEQRKRELESELTEVNEQIRALKPIDDTLAVYRAVRSAVKGGNRSLENIANASGFDIRSVEAMLNRHLTGKGDKSPIFVLKEGQYHMAPKLKKA